MLKGTAAAKARAMGVREHTCAECRCDWREDAPVVECINLTHYYGSRLIYRDLNFTVARGSVLGLLGKNGTGKTTTINILNGYLKPSAGSCKLLGHEAQRLPGSVRQRVALLLEGHVQYPFMNIEQAERYLSAFYPRWNREVYYELVSRLRIAPKQRIGSMSCGQRSQVALGLILAQNADLLILDDFTLGLDPGYRRLFVEYLQEYVVAEGKTVFVTSHIIQDLERFIKECIIMDYGRILLQCPVETIMRDCRIYEYMGENLETLEQLLGNHADTIYHPERHHGCLRFASLQEEGAVKGLLDGNGISSLPLKVRPPKDLEDAFVGLTGED